MKESKSPADEAFHRLAEQPDEFVPGLRRVLGGQPHAQSFQHRAHVAEMEDMVELEARDDGAAVRNAVDQAAIPSTPNTAGRAARRILGELLLAELGAGGHVAAGNPIPQGLHDLRHRLRGGALAVRPRLGPAERDNPA